MADISGATLAEFNIPLRSSVLGMKSLKRILEATGNPLTMPKIKIQEGYINANAQIAAAKLKALGIKLIFHKDTDDDHIVEKDVIMPLHIEGFTIYDTPLNKWKYQYLLKEYKEYINGVSIVESYPGEKQDVAWAHIFDKNKDNIDLVDFITDDVKDILKIVTKKKHVLQMKEHGVLTDEEYEIYDPVLEIPENME